MNQESPLVYDGERQALIVAAEAAENDSFFYSFFGKMDNEDEAFSEALMSEYRLFKKQKTFEQLMK